MKNLLSFFVLLSFFSSFSRAETEPKVNTFCQGKPYISKLTSELLKMRLSCQMVDSPSDFLSQYAPYAIREGQLQCIVGLKRITQEIIDLSRECGLTVCRTNSSGNLHQMVVRCDDPNQFDQITSHPDVLGITTEPYAFQMAGTIQNEADRSIRAAQVREMCGLDGSGVRIGILSDSIADRSKQGRIFDQFILGTPSQMRKELPKSIRFIDLGDGSGEDEGSAMMELIHDLAPGAAFTFAAVKYDYTVYPKNIRKLWNDEGYECDILVDDIHFLKEPLYQHGPIALAAREAVVHGVHYFTAAGNYGNNAHERPFTDANPQPNYSFPPNGNNFHDFGVAYGLSSDTHLAVRMPRFSTILLTLHWDEPYGGILASGPGSQSDLDMYLVSDETLPLRDGNNGNILASSVDIQGDENNPAGEPVEFLYYTNTIQDRTVHITINHANGRIPNLLHLFIVFDSSSGITLLDKHLIQDRTLIGHMTVPETFTIAAIPYREINSNGEYIEPIEEWNVANYSALGGNLPILFSDDGETRLQEPIWIAKPDLSGPDNTSTSVEGFGIFSGTSAAASNVTAVASLILQKKPGLSPQELREILQGSAIDLESEGWDALSGWGLVDAWNVIQSMSSSSVPFWEAYKTSR